MFIALEGHFTFSVEGKRVEARSDSRCSVR